MHDERWLHTSMDEACMMMKDGYMGFFFAPFDSHVPIQVPLYYSTAITLYGIEYLIYNNVIIVATTSQEHTTLHTQI